VNVRLPVQRFAGNCVADVRGGGCRDRAGADLACLSDAGVSTTGGVHCSHRRGCWKHHWPGVSAGSANSLRDARSRRT